MTRPDPAAVAPPTPDRLGKQRLTELERQARVRYCSMRDGARVRVLDFDLAPKVIKPSLLLVPGLATVFESWHRAVLLLTSHFRIFFFESREKVSSLMPDRESERGITLHRMAMDLEEVVAQLALDNDGFYALASSTGCTLLIEALSSNWIRPAGVILVGPMTRHRISRTAAFLTSCVPVAFKNLAMPFFQVYLHVVYANRKRSPEQFAKYVRAAADVQLPKVAGVLKEMTRHDCSGMVPKVKTPCLVVAESSDNMHLLAESQRFAQLLPRARLVDLGTNKAAHGQPLVDAILAFVAELGPTRKCGEVLAG
jgi:pimeloyl-ACP methyl ester carboxylesterase